MLSAFGLSETAERIYLALVDGPSGSLPELAERLAADPADLDQAVVDLQHAGLVRLTDGRVGAAPPELAIDALLTQRTRQLQEARVSLREWLRQRAAGPADQGVRMVVGAAAITQTFDQFLRGAQEEVLGFDRPPYATDYYDNPTELELLERGIRFRVVYDRRVLERPHAVEQIGRFVAAGEQARVATDVPGKLAVADRRVALLSFPGRDDSAEPWALMVQGATWVDVLVALFAEVWDRATPLRLAPAGGVLDDADRWTVPTATDRRILSLLMTGLPDKAVASQLGMSLRTVQRRLRQLMDVTGSATRMQLGWYAARNDWL
ncbi:winged helix-turn-helix domain-containing protein [Solwaraspora sp. WMMD406]|uniref:winged helix-turn-helix domain-containing protein n=1 Tax=Solwaraspora sp. WMMD406 TaxID=3016095 RepID=UPI002415AE39|nr:winged helix-turn-helix domain-containing protein [Solwaraspora sp. WMMD406]MDG4764533.1 winged helix-turn-helix domain-containing protein [Solwaraspora sp. WMMD406]